MTPEERFKKIEGAISDLIVAGRTQNETIQKQNEGIQALIVVSRTVLTSIQEDRATHREDHKQMIAEIDKLREAQAATDEKLNILIDTVDRIIRRRNGQV